MVPVVAEIEPVTEGAMQLQIQVVELCRACIPMSFLMFPRNGNAVVGSVGIVRTLAELKFISMVIGTVICLEDSLVQLFQRLVAADFNHAADLLVGELLAGWPATKYIKKTYKFAGGAATGLACLCGGAEPAGCLRLFHGGISSSGTSN